jgi:hypothetical protein
METITQGMKPSIGGELIVAAKIIPVVDLLSAVSIEGVIALSRTLG